MIWKVIVTNKFSSVFKKYKKNSEVVKVLNSKITRLKENPFSVGGNLAGNLKGKKSIRLVGKLRLIFEIDDKSNKVYLLAIDHRKFDYKRF